MNLYCVELSSVLYVTANDAAEAERVALANVREETPEVEGVERITPTSAIWHGHGDGIPWGEGDPSAPDRTVDGWLEAMKLDEAEQARLADLEARQGKLFEGVRRSER